MNEEFVQHALSNGVEGALWLQMIPEIIAAYETKWSLKVFPPFPLTYNYVAPCLCSDGTQAVLKIGFPGDREFQTEGEALAVFRGNGNMVKRVYEFAEQPMTGEVQRAVEPFIAANPRGRLGRIEYHLEDFGLDPRERRQALRFY